MSNRGLSIDYSRSAGTPFDRGFVGSLCAIVVGAGALGSEVVKMLGLLGWGEVRVVDPDVVEASNLTRAVLLRDPASIGRNKAEAIVAAGRALFPDTRWRAFGVEIADLGFQWLRGQSVLFGCVDSELARLEIASITNRLDLPCCDGGLAAGGASRGRASFFPARDGACFCCTLTPETRRGLLTQWISPRHPCGAGEIAGAETVVPSTPAIASVVAGLQVELAVRELRYRSHREARSWEVSLEASPRLDEIAIPLSDTCPFHDHDEQVALLECEPVMTVRDLLRRAESAVGPDALLLLDWPLCVAARCLDCGAGWRPMRRLAAVRRRCPECDGAHIELTRVVDHIDLDSDFADAELSLVGVPERHLCTVVRAKGAV